MNTINIKTIKKLTEKLLVLALVLFMQTGILQINVKGIEADNQYKVEVYRGYGRQSGTEKATDVFKTDVQDTGYSFAGYYDGSVITTTSNNKSRINFPCDTAGAAANSLDIYYGNNEKYTWSLTSIDGNEHFLYLDGNNNVTTNSNGTEKFISYKTFNNHSTYKYNLYIKFYKIADNLDIVINYKNGTKTATFNNVKDVIPRGEKNSTHNNTTNVVEVTLPGRGSPAATYSTPAELTVSPLDNKVLESIDIDYANKYKAQIKDFTKSYYFNKSATMTESDSSSYNCVAFVDNTFMFKEIAANYTITYNYKSNITFDANGGVIGEDSETSKTLQTLDDKLAEIPTASWTDTDTNIKHQFDGWYDAQTGGNKVELTTSTIFTEDKTYYAHYKSNYKVTFDLQGGSFKDGSTENKIVYTAENFSGKVSALPEIKKIKVDDQSKTWYFVGWYDGQDPTTANKVDEDTVFTKDTTVYACWTDQTYTVTFDYATSKTGLDNTTEEVGKGLTATRPSPDPVVDGYAFINWYKDDKYEELFDYDTEINEATTIYGRFEEVVNVTVLGGLNESGKVITTNDESKFVEFVDDNNKVIVIKEEESGSFTIHNDHGNLKEIKVNDETVSLTDLSGTIYIDSTGTKTTSHDGNDQLALTKDDNNIVIDLLKVKEDTTIELVHNKVKVTFNAEGIDGYPKDSVEFDWGTKVTLPENPSKEHADFVNWYLEEAFQNVFNEDSLIYENINLYAKFKDYYKVEIVYGYGKAYNANARLAKVLEINGLYSGTDDGCSLTGYTKGYNGNASSGTDNSFQLLKQIEVDYVDVYYGNEKITIPHSISGGGNSIIKAVVYLNSEGKLDFTNNTGSYPAGTTKLITFAASSDSAAGNVATRWFNTMNNVKVVFHYYHSNKISFSDIKTVTLNNFSSNLFDSTNNTATVAGTYKNVTNPFSFKVTKKDEKNVDYIEVKVDDTTVKIAHADLGKTLYLSSDNTFSETKNADTDILEYKNNVFTFYNVSKDINVKYIYQYKVTFDANGGAFADGSTTKEVLSVDGKVDLGIEPTYNPYYFNGWQDEDSNPISVPARVTADMTLKAIWNNTKSFTITVANAFNSEGNNPIETVDTSKWQTFDAENAKGRIAENVKGSSMNVYAVYGSLNNIDINTHSIDVSDIINTTKTIYVDKDFNKQNSASNNDVMSISHSAGNKYLTITFNAVKQNLSLTLNYNKVKVKFLYEDGTTAVEEKEINFNTAIEQPEDPSKEGFAFDGWYKDKVLTSVFDFSTKLLDDTNIYAKTVKLHTVQFNGLGYKTTSTIVSSTWTSLTGGELDTINRKAITRGDYSDTTGVALNAYTDLLCLTNVKFKVGKKEVSIPQTDLIGKTYYLDKDGNLTTSHNSDDILKFVVNSTVGGQANTNTVNLRFYNIKEDLSISFISNDRHVKLVDNDRIVSSFNFDRTTRNTKINGTVATAPENDFLGTKDNYLRLAIKPISGMMTAIKIIDSEGKEIVTWKPGDVATEQFYEGVGKITCAINGETFLVRCNQLLKDINIIPVKSDKGTEYTVKIENSDDLSITHEALKKGEPNEKITVSDDKKTITVPAGSLTSSAEGESFRWNLGSSACTDYEYYKIEVKDSKGAIITTIGDDLKSISEVGNKDQTVFFANVRTHVKYNKSKYGDAQIRIWGVTQDLILTVYLKNYSSGEVIAAKDAKLDIEHTVSVVYETNDKLKRSVYFDYITPDSVVEKNELKEDNKITLKAKSLTGSNAEISRDESGNVAIVTANILRIRLTELSKYRIDKVILITGEGSNAVTWDSSENYDSVTNVYKAGKVSGLGDFKYVADGSTRYIRFNAIYAAEPIKVKIVYSQIDGPYKVVLDSDDDLHIDYGTKNPSSVNVSNDYKTLYVPEGALPKAKDGESIVWSLASTAGMDFEYSKLEVWDTKNNKLLGTLGANSKSYRDNLEKDQTFSSSLKGIKIRYNKSKYGEAQIRIWEVYNNVKLVLYYKNYDTGEEYKANDSHLSFKYDGIVTLVPNGSKLEIVEKKCNITKLDGVKKIRFNEFCVQEDGVKYNMTNVNLGENIDYITIDVDGKTYEIGKDVEISKAASINVPGGKIKFARTTDGYAQIRLWAISNDMTITLHKSYNHAYHVTFLVGEGGTARVTDIPATAMITDDLSYCTVWQGSTNNSTSGKKTSIRWDVTPKIGYELDYIVMTTKGQSYTINHRTLKDLSKTLITNSKPGCAIRYNVDSNGVAQIRAVHVDADTVIKVYYRQTSHKVTINTQKLAVMRAEGYNTGSLTEFTPNYAVATVTAGTTNARQSGIKYWLKPLDGHKITSAVIEDIKGNVVICGVDFAETEYEDYKVKGATIRYYQGYDGKAELRVWGVTDDVKITIFYDGDTPRGGIAIPEDIETYDLGVYEETFDNRYDLERIINVIDDSDSEGKKTAAWIPVAGFGGVAIVGAVIYGIVSKRNKKKK